MVRNLLLAGLILAAACLPSSPSRAAEATIAGDWHGEWVKSGDHLPVTFTFHADHGHVVGAFGSDALQAAGIPVSGVVESGSNVRFQIKGDDSTTTFDAKIDGSTMVGTFTDGNSKGAFKLARTAGEPSLVRTRDVTFRNDDVTLSGTLMLPSTSGRHPAVLFLQGSGPEGRWANRYLAESLSRAGIVALTYDKRGVGGSSGDWTKVGFDGLAADGAAGVNLLRAQPEVDAAEVGIYGHSQGGTIAPLVVKNAKGIGFVIASAAVGVNPEDAEIFSVGNDARIDRLAKSEQDDARTYVRALVTTAYRGGDHARLDALAAKFKDRSWFIAPPAPDNGYWTISRAIGGFDPAKAWSAVNAPVLLIYGGHDERVPAAASIAAIVKALHGAGNDRVTVRQFPNADHTFTIVDPAHAHAWPMHVPDYASTISAWVLAKKRP